MKILVCVSKTPDTTAKIAFTDNNTKFENNGVQWIINPYDEWYALVRAIELKEANPSAIIHLVTVAAADADPTGQAAASTRPALEGAALAVEKDEGSQRRLGGDREPLAQTAVSRSGAEATTGARNARAGSAGVEAARVKATGRLTSAQARQTGVVQRSSERTEGRDRDSMATRGG